MTWTPCGSPSATPTSSSSRDHSSALRSCGGSFANSFAHSCNSVFAPLGVKIGAEKLVETAERYGFNGDPAVPGAVPSTIPAAGDIASPLIFAASYADFLAIDRDRFEIAAVTGNSMGWYTALACGGAASAEAGFRIVDAMGQNSQAGEPGGGGGEPQGRRRGRLRPLRQLRQRRLLAVRGRLPEHVRVPTGWRVTARPGRDQRRARDLLRLAHLNRMLHTAGWAAAPRQRHTGSSGGHTQSRLHSRNASFTILSSSEW